MWVLVISSSSSEGVGPLRWLLFSLSFPPGNILDYSHHPWTRILLRQFWNQPLPNHIRWSCQEGGWSVQARKTCHHTFCQSGVFLKAVNPLWLALHVVYYWCLSLQSSKCRSVFSSAQKLEGYKRLDRQLAQFNDYNFVFTSYAQQNQQSWGCRMKRRKKEGGCLAITPHPSFCLYISPWCSHHCTGSSCGVVATSPTLSSSLSCLHCGTCNLDILHESSSLCFAILAHSCCDLEVHVEELIRLSFRPSTYATQYNGPFLQVSPLILHRQGFRPH